MLQVMQSTSLTIIDLPTSWGQDGIATQIVQILDKTSGVHNGQGQMTVTEDGGCATGDEQRRRLSPVSTPASMGDDHHRGGSAQLQRRRPSPGGRCAIGGNQRHWRLSVSKSAGLDDDHHPVRHARAVATPPRSGRDAAPEMAGAPGVRRGAPGLRRWQSRDHRLRSRTARRVTRGNTVTGSSSDQ